MHVERNGDNLHDYNEESDEASQQDENEVLNLPPIQLQRQRGQIFRSFDVEYAFGWFWSCLFNLIPSSPRNNTGMRYPEQLLAVWV